MVKGSVVLLDPDFPHGTVEGCDRGCRGGACPAAIACRDVKRRYGSDLDFRRLVDAGVPLEEIVLRDRAAAEHDAEVEWRRRKGQPDPAPLTLDAADLAEARRPKPSPPAVRPADLVRPVPDVDDPDVVVPPEVALQTEIEAAPEAVPAVRPRKWQVRKVWMAIAPDGSAHGPFDGQQEGLTFVSAQFPAPVADRAAEPTNVPEKRTRRAWTTADDDRARALWETGLSDSAIGRAMGRDQGTVGRKLRRIGLASNGAKAGAS